MADNQTTRKGHKLVPMRPEDRLAYLLRLERDHALQNLLQEGGFDAADLHDSKERRLEFFRDLLGEMVCEEGYPLQIDAEDLFKNVNLDRVMSTLHEVDPPEVMRRLFGKSTRNATDEEAEEVRCEVSKRGINKGNMN